jgi:NosR/NirI family nitrous oxide reductase transcriptional regulator
MRYLMFVLLAGLLTAVGARAEDPPSVEPIALDFFPQADRMGEFGGDPPAAPVYRDQRLLGYVFRSSDVVRIPAYSGKSVNILVGFDMTGRITGLKIIEHSEPILVVGVSEDDLRHYVDQYAGVSVLDRVKLGGAPREGYVTVDGISGATITAMVMNATVMRAAKRVAASRGIPRRAETGAATGGSGDGLAGQSETQAARVAPSWWFGASSEPFWVTVWRERWWQLVVLMAALGILTLILLFQDLLTRRPRLLAWVRTGYLVFTLVFIGWYTLAQLSVVHVLTFINAVLHQFSWEAFLVDPLIFTLWAFVALTLLLWGRGVYCGWLCPFGSLQELTNQIARRLRVPQYSFPHVVHERLWALKYVMFVGLFGLSLQSIGHAAKAAEIEPFKTAIVLHFHREWGFVVYAAGLVLLSAFNRKFFCKYLCPLGAALAIPAPLRIFDWLRRRRECGRPCQICARECEVQAIRPTGEINANECHYCLDCQVTYWDDHRCPPLNERRIRRDKSRRALDRVRKSSQSAPRDDSGAAAQPLTGD